MKEESFSFKNFYYPIIYFVSAILLEIGTFVSLGFGVLPKYFLFDFAILLSFFGILFLTSNKIAQMIISFILIFTQALVSYVNVTLFRIYGDLFSFDMLTMGVEAFKSFDSSFLNYWFLFYIIAILITSTTLMAISLKNKITMKLSKKIALTLSIIFVSMQGAAVGGYALSVSTLKINETSVYDKYFNNDKNLFNSLFIKTESLKKFGTFGYYSKNLSNMMFKNYNSTNYEETRDYIKSGVYNKANNYTGKLKDDNLIVIMCESLEWYAIDPITTPTLYDLFYNGVKFNNYVSKSKTNFSEMDVILGSVPSNNTFTNSWRGSNSLLLNNEMPFTLPSKIKSAGYDSAKFFHDNEGNFYGRIKTHKTFGFDEVIAIEDMDFSGSEGAYSGFGYERDSDMIKTCINEIAPTDKNFFSFITTVTSHGPYKENPRLKNYYKELDNGKYDESLKWINENTSFKAPKPNSDTYDILKLYKAAFMDLDKGLEFLINHLVSNNLMENTSLVLFSDHNAYYQELSYDLRGFDKKIYYNPDLYRVPATIYSEKLGKMEINDFTCPYNLTPTIFDLLGINFNTNIYMAPSIFDEDFNKTIFVSQIGGIIRDGMYSDNVEIIYTLKDVTDEDIYNFKQDALNFYIKQDWINNMYNSNIFKYYKGLYDYI